MGQLSEFLSSAKSRFLEDLNAGGVDKWTVVMGNEAGDLDTIASSVAYSYLASTLSNQPTIALIQTPRSDLYLRAENLFTLQLASLDPKQQDLLCIDDIPTSHPISSFSKFVLVDHNKLLRPYGGGGGKVVGIIDHHTDEQAHPDAEFRDIVNPVGSCASLVARRFRSAWEAKEKEKSSTVPPEVATLLLSAIYIDTGGLKPGDKAEDIDREAAAFLVSRSSLPAASGSNPATASTSASATTATADGEAIPSIDRLAKELSHRKKAVDHLSSRDLLRRDYKEYTFGGLQTGLSTVPYGLKPWVEKDTAFWESLEKWMGERELSVLGVLTTYTSPKKGHKREVVVLLRGDGVSPELEKRLWKQLEKNKDLQLETKKQVKVGKQRRAKVWNQGNVKATRKLFAPLLGSILDGTSTEAPVEEKKKKKKKASADK